MSKKYTSGQMSTIKEFFNFWFIEPLYELYFYCLIIFIAFKGLSSPAKTWVLVTLLLIIYIVVGIAHLLRPCLITFFLSMHQDIHSIYL